MTASFVLPPSPFARVTSYAQFERKLSEMQALGMTEEVIARTQIEVAAVLKIDCDICGTIWAGGSTFEPRDGNSGVMTVLPNGLVFVDDAREYLARHAAYVHPERKLKFIDGESRLMATYETEH